MNLSEEADLDIDEIFDYTGIGYGFDQAVAGIYCDSFKPVI